MASRAYRGPNDRQYKTVSDKTVAGAYLPCTFVTESASALTAATAFGPMLRLLLDRAFYAASAAHFTATDPLLTAYASGDSGVAAVLEPGQTYQVAMAAATYTYGQEVIVAAAGRAAAAASTNVVIGFTKFAGAKSAGDLGDIEICMPYVKA
jgi:protein-disulfide isomerase